MNTDIMNLAPDINEIKCLLHDIVSRGTQAKIANFLGVSAADFSHRCNPDHDRKPGLVEGLREAWAIAAVDQEAYRKLKAYLDGLLESWTEQAKPTEKNLSGLLGDAAQQITELQRARFIENKPVHDQLEQALAVKVAIDQFIAGLGNQFELKQGTLKIAK